jgi:type IV pilus assembly protein PilC
MESLQEGLNRGQSLSQSLREFPDTFSTLFVSMVSAGEESGNLSGSLKIVGEQIEKTYLLQKKVKGAMMYPGIIFCVMIAIAVLMFIFVVPKLTATFAEFKTELPLTTRIVIGTSEILKDHFLVVLILGIFAGMGIRMYAKTVAGKKIFHRVFLKIPIIGPIVQEVNSARLARTLSSLLTSGVDVVGSIGITADVVQNYHYQNMLHEVAEKIQKGQPLAPLFAEREDLYPVFVGEMIGVGEETGTLSKVLFDIAVYYENEVDQKTKDLSTVIEPFLMVFIGVGVGFFALAMISPIYSIGNNIQ